MRAAHVGAFVLASFVFAHSANATTIVLDAWTDPLPPNPCLPHSAQTIVFVGPVCDGVACPPDSTVRAGSYDESCKLSEQHGLTGVLGGSRWIHVYAPGSPVGATLAHVQSETRQLEYEIGNGRGYNLFKAEYGDAAIDATTFDLTSTRRFHMSIAGDFSPERPLTAYLTLYSQPASEFELAYSTAPMHLTQPGDVVIPFANFSTSPSFRLDRVTVVDLEMNDCPGHMLGQDCTPLPIRTLTLGPLLFESDDGTPAVRHTWGQLKAAYR